MYILHVFCFIYKIREILRGYQRLKHTGVAFLVHKLDTQLHIRILLFLCLFRNLQVFCRLNDFFTLGNQILFNLVKLLYYFL